jgi:hypothetical protein
VICERSWDFVPDPSNLVVAKPDPGYVGPAPAASYFKLSPVDLAGNASPSAVMTLANLLDAYGPENLGFAPDGVRANPARNGHRVVDVALARPGPAVLTLLDITGRRVIEREMGSRGVGRHQVDVARYARRSLSIPRSNPTSRFELAMVRDASSINSGAGTCGQFKALEVSDPLRAIPESLWPTAAACRPPRDPEEHAREEDHGREHDQVLDRQSD